MIQGGGDDDDGGVGWGEEAEWGRVCWDGFASSFVGSIDPWPSTPRRRVVWVRVRVGSDGRGEDGHDGLEEWKSGMG